VRLDKYESNRRGLKDLLGSEGVRRDLVVRAHRVAAVAQADYDADPPHEGRVDVAVESAAGDAGNLRSRAVVIAKHPAALAIEADRRVLGSALDAGR
jgi:hypothetical protein